VTSPKNLLLAALTVLTVAASLIAWQQYRRAQPLPSTTSSQQLELTEKLKAAQTYISDLEARLAAQTAAASPSETNTAEVGTTPASASRRAPEPPDNSQDSRRAALAALRNDPEFMQLVATQQRGQIDGRYATLFRQLNLSPSQIDAFKNLLLEKQNARREVMMAAQENGLNPRENRDELRKLVEQSNTETDAEILSLLGQEKFNQYQTYESTGSQRALVEQIGRSLSYSSAPLTDAQSMALVQILAQNQPAGSADTSAPERFQRSITITDAVISQARRILAPEQVKALQEQQAAQQAAARLQELMRGAGRDRNRPAP
jgi:hypothetical protein